MLARHDRFQRSLDEPLTARSRLVLALCVAPLALAFTGPLWTISMQAPQYPQGLRLEIFAHTVEGDVAEVNTLNHYIGMAPIDRSTLSDLDWLPFAIGALILFALRIAAIGDVRSLVDLAVAFLYFGCFSMARFVYRLYVFGHDLDPAAAFDVEPFTPAILGTKTVANFTISAYPGAGTAWVALFAIGLAVALARDLPASWRAVSEQR